MKTKNTIISSVLNIVLSIGSLFLNFPMLIIFAIARDLNEASNSANENIRLKIITILLWCLIAIAIINVVVSIISLICAKKGKSGILITFLSIVCIFTLLNVAMLILVLPSLAALIYFAIIALGVVCFILTLLEMIKNKKALKVKENIAIESVNETIDN